MPEKPPKPSKRDAILDAMLTLVVERGFHDAPMSVVVQRSGASAGVIYHHFPSKEAILQALYGRVHALKLASFLEGYSPEMEPKAAFLHVWDNLYRFHRQHPREMRFLELYKSAGFPCQPDSLSALALAFAQQFRTQSEGGALRNWPPAVLEEMTSGLVARLADHAEELPPAVLREIAEGVWGTVQAK